MRKDKYDYINILYIYVYIYFILYTTNSAKTRKFSEEKHTIHTHLNHEEKENLFENSVSQSKSLTPYATEQRQLETISTI